MSRTAVSPSVAIADTVYLCPSDRAARGWRRHLTERGVPFRDCLAIETWLASLWARAALFGLIADAPTLLPQDAQRALWHRLAASHSNLLTSECDRVVTLVDEAWLLAERHGLPLSPASATGVAADDNAAWFAAIRVAARRWLGAHRLLTRAELPARLAESLPLWRPLLPSRLCLTPSFATDPALERLWRTIAAAGVDVATADAATAGGTEAEPDAPAPVVERTHDPDHDRDAALQWAADQLASSSGEVTLIVPDLTAQRGAWQRALRARFGSDWWLAPSADGERFNLSLGQPIAAHPAIGALLVLLAATSRPMAVESIAQALIHPRWGVAMTTANCVHRCLQEQIDHGIAESMLDVWPTPVAMQQVLHALRPAAGTRSGENDRRRSRREHRQTIDAVVAALSTQAMIARSELFQFDEAWLLLLQRWEQFDRWFPSLSWQQALSELERLAADTVFQPKAGQARLQVVGLLESAGVPLASARLVGLSDRVLPEAYAPNPLLPRAWQSAHGVGLGSRAEALGRAQRLLHNWRSLIRQWTLSCPMRNDDGEVGLSPLLHGWPTQSVAVAVPRPRRPAVLETVADEALPEEADAVLASPLSASRLREQAQCPRRAAAIRLGLRPWPALAAGITPIVRGNLVHGMLAAYGVARMTGADAQTAALAQLDALIADERRTRPAIAAVAWQTERARIAVLLQRVIEREARRTAFAVVAVEQPLEAMVAGQPFTGKLDRIDDDGHLRVIFDYKTGKVSRNDWRMERNSGRLADPQLPLYALMHEANRSADADVSPVRAVAWFTVNDDSVDCIGVGDDDDLLPRTQRGATPIGWGETMVQWQQGIAALVDEWRRGVAEVAPIKGGLTCRTCEYGAFCRERWSLSGSDGAAGNDSGDEAEGGSDE